MNGVRRTAGRVACRRGVDARRRQADLAAAARPIASDFRFAVARLPVSAAMTRQPVARHPCEEQHCNLRGGGEGAGLRVFVEDPGAAFFCSPTDGQGHRG